MNEFLLLVIVIIYLAINPLYSKPKRNYFIASGESNEASRTSAHVQ
jgi:hypothetical protein